jgi:hypothetical protein
MLDPLVNEAKGSSIYLCLLGIPVITMAWEVCNDHDENIAHGLGNLGHAPNHHPIQLKYKLSRKRVHYLTLALRRGPDPTYHSCIGIIM